MTIIHTVKERFLKYVKYDTQSDYNSTSVPSTAKQKLLSAELVKELLQLGIKDAHLDEFGYVFATVPANSQKNVPVICFCSHVDTSPDCSGENVKPIIHNNYNGEDLVLPDDNNVVLKMAEHPDLSAQIGNDIITASGKTLLGADNKAGVATIMDAVNFFTQNPDVKHGEIKILFTPDEEIGRGVNHLDIKKLGADFGYTIDGETLGSFEDETFSADGMQVKIKGVSTHPGFAKNKMQSAIKIAGQIINALPKDKLSPESTEGKEGFIHPVGISGQVEEATIDFIIRDFEDEHLLKHENELKAICNAVLSDYPDSTVEFVITEQYRNMKNIVAAHPKVSAFALKAIERAGVKPKRQSIRGGTDGSRLSFMGLPCPNIFAGEHAFHSKQEWVSVQDMEAAVRTIINLAMIWEEEC
ncbi:peptidase T [Pedobacter arcticus]|uniref:peptidase T n=1 Tax=Pedobacter arcticus TaxID=752140 RepID=UPI00030E2D03|nr:peptidase T [Pedobacter arcticus]